MEWWIRCSFYAGFEKQKELSMMNTMQVRQEALDIMKKLNGLCFYDVFTHSLPKRWFCEYLPIPMFDRTSWKWKIVCFQRFSMVDELEWFFVISTTSAVATTGLPYSSPLPVSGPTKVFLFLWNLFLSRDWNQNWKLWSWSCRLPNYRNDSSIWRFLRPTRALSKASLRRMSGLED